MHRRRITLLLVAAFAIVAAACGSSSKAATTPTTRLNAEALKATFPVTVKTANGAITIPSRPTHVVSLSPTATEMLFAIGAGSQVAAVDDQ